MKPFSYIRPSSVDELVATLSTYGRDALVLAGGTDVIVRLQTGRFTPKVVVDIKRVQALSNLIGATTSGLRFGARTTMTTIVGDARCMRDYPALVEAARVVGSIQIRNRATLAGNLCNASPAADTAPPLLAYGATLNLVGPSGRRQVALQDFITGPGRTVLQVGEIVESVDLPRPTVRTGAAFGRVTRRYGVDLATINLCALVTATGETRVAYGAVGPRPFVVADSSGTLASVDALPGDKTAALAALIAGAAPISDVRGSKEYRLAMLDVMTRRALTTAIERCRAAGGAGES